MKFKRYNTPPKQRERYFDNGSEQGEILKDDNKIENVESMSRLSTNCTETIFKYPF